jgi:hypothetical protein
MTRGKKLVGIVMVGLVAMLAGCAAQPPARPVELVPARLLEPAPPPPPPESVLERQMIGVATLRR